MTKHGVRGTGEEGAPRQAQNQQEGGRPSLYPPPHPPPPPPLPQNAIHSAPHPRPAAGRLTPPPLPSCASALCALLPPAPPSGGVRVNMSWGEPLAGMLVEEYTQLGDDVDSMQVMNWWWRW